jgi:integrase
VGSIGSVLPDIRSRPGPRALLPSISLNITSVGRVFRNHKVITNRQSATAFGTAPNWRWITVPFSLNANLRVPPALGLVEVSLLTVSETAEFLHVSTSWVRRHLGELPVVPALGRLIRIDAEKIQSRMNSGKSLEPIKEPIMINRFQRGGVFLDGRNKDVWKGTFRLDELNAKGKRKPVKVTLGTKKELPTKAAAHKKLTQIMDERMKPGAAVVSTKVMKFGALVEEWKGTEGMALERSTLANYTNTLRACVLPTFADQDVRTINRKAIQDFLTKQAKSYSKSYIKSMPVVLTMTLKSAGQNGYLQQPDGWLDSIRLPRETFHGREVIRVELTPEQNRAFVERMKQPYSTLALLLQSVPMRGEAAIGLQPSDLDEQNVIHVRRIIYGGQAEMLEKEEQYPLDAVVHADLIRRMRTLGQGQEWIFHSRKGTLLSLGNARRRHLHPAAEAIGVAVGGWHDFRHTTQRMMRRSGVNPVVISGVMGHKNMELAPEVYDKASPADIREALSLVGKQLLPCLLPSGTVQ